MAPFLPSPALPFKCRDLHSWTISPGRGEAQARWYSPSWGTQYTGPSSVVSKEEKEAREDHDGEGCSRPEGGSRKLQLSVLSRS